MIGQALKKRSIRCYTRTVHNNVRCHPPATFTSVATISRWEHSTRKPNVSYHVIRHFSNEDFKSMLNRMKKNLESDKDDSENKSDVAESIDKQQTAAKVAASDDKKSPSEEGSVAEAEREDVAEEKDEKTDAAKDATQEPSDTANTSSSFNFTLPKISVDDVMRWSKEASFSFKENVELAYSEMMGETKETSLKRKVQQAATFRKAGSEDDDEDEMKYDGPSAIVVVDQPKSAWEQMKERLQDSPFIKDVLKGSREVGKAAADTDLGKKAQNIGRNVQDKIEDAREFWETSQNPLVYTISGVWENITGQTEEGNVISELRKLDPNFDKEKWVAEVRENLAPTVLKAHLLGDTKSLKPWLSEGVYNKLAADIRTRKHDGISFDTNILDMDETQVIMKFTDSGSPAVIITYMVQQINCVRNRKGEVIEGGETEIRAKFYVMAFQQEYDEDTGYVEWKVVDYLLAGDIPYY